MLGPAPFPWCVALYEANAHLWLGEMHVGVCVGSFFALVAFGICCFFFLVLFRFIRACNVNV